MGAHADAAAHMAHDQIQLFIGFAYLFGVALGHGFLVQGVEHALAGDQRMAGIAGHIAKLIHHRRIHNERGNADLIADLPGNQAAQIAGMLSGNAFDTVFQQRIGGGIGAAVDGLDQTAAAADGVDGFQVDLMLFQCVHDQLLAPLLLIGNRGEFRDLLGRMTERFVKEHLFIVEKADLGGSGTGVDDKDSVSHFLFLLLYGNSPQYIP